MRATAFVVACTCVVSPPLSSVGSGRFPSSAIVAAISDICSGVVSTRPWPIADEPTARSSPISSADGIVERAAPARPCVLVEAEALGGRDQPASAELGAQRREDAVAGVGEGGLQRAAAGLAVGVLDLDAFELGRGLVREGVAALGHVLLQHAGERHDLERAAGRLRRRLRDPGQRQDLAGLRAHGGDPAVTAGERFDGRALHGGVDAGAHRLPGHRRSAGDHPVAGVERPAGLAGQAVVELALQPGEADRGAVRHAAGAQLGGARGRGGADASGDLRRELAEVRVGETIGPACDHGPVARLDRPARRQLGLAPQPLAAAQAGEGELGPPVDAGAARLAVAGRDDERAVQPAEDARVHRHRDAHGVAVLAHLAGRELGEREHRGGLLVGALQAAPGRALARRVGQAGVHAVIVGALPVGGELRDDLALRRDVARPDHESGDERRQRGERDRREASRIGDRAPPPLARAA